MDGWEGRSCDERGVTSTETQRQIPTRGGERERIRRGGYEYQDARFISLSTSVSQEAVPIRLPS